MVKEDKTSKLIVATGKVIEIADYSREAMRLHIESNMKRYIVREMNNRYSILQRESRRSFKTV